MAIYIDTEIWIFAQKIPDLSKFQNELKYQNALRLHKKASEFLSQKIIESEINMTYHQLCEIYHSLAFRGTRLPAEFVSSYCNQLLTSKFMYWYQVLVSHVEQAIIFSKKSHIHIWDYLCILPLYKDVEIIYTCDKHFNHDTFQSLGTKIENPLDKWITL